MHCCRHKLHVLLLLLPHFFVNTHINNFLQVHSCLLLYSLSFLYLLNRFHSLNVRFVVWIQELDLGVRINEVKLVLYLFFLILFIFAKYLSHLRDYTTLIPNSLIVVRLIAFKHLDLRLSVTIIPAPVNRKVYLLKHIGYNETNLAILLVSVNMI